MANYEEKEMDSAPMAEQEPEAAPEDAIVDQIGELLAQLSPEKQAQVAQKLAEMTQPQEQAVPAEAGGTVDPMGRGVPV